MRWVWIPSFGVIVFRRNTETAIRLSRADSRMAVFQVVHVLFCFGLFRFVQIDIDG